MQILTINGGSLNVNWALFDGNVPPRKSIARCVMGKVGEDAPFVTERILNTDWSHEVDDRELRGVVDGG